MSDIKKNIKLLLNKATGIKFSKKKLPETNDIQKILIISLYFAGDLLFHSTVIEILKKLHPNTSIDLWTRSSSAALLRNDPRIDNFILYDNLKTTDYRDQSAPDEIGYKNLINDLKIKNYSLIIDLTGKRATALAVKQIDAGYSIGLNYDYNGRAYDKFVYSNTASEKGHLIDKYLNVIKSGLNIDNLKWQELRKSVLTKPYIYSDPDSVLKAEKILEKMGLRSKSFAAIHLTSGWPAKVLPLKTFSDLIVYLESEGINYVLVGDSNDKKRAAEIDEMFSNKYDLKNKFAEADFKCSSELIKLSRLFIGSDSAPLHIASAYDIPAVALFGPTNPGFSAPTGKNVKIIYHKLHCSASDDKQYCTRNGGFTCPYYECMASISSSEIINAVKELWGSGKVNE